MYKRLTLRLALCCVCLFTVLVVISPASATCMSRELDDSSNTFISSDIGTTEDDIIICTNEDRPTGDVRGLEDNDTILIYFAANNQYDILGGDVPVTGNDTIIVFQSGHVDEIAGDRDTTGGNKGGNDQITLYGTANWVYGDDVTSNTTSEEGGDDSIDIFGTVHNSVMGENLRPNTNHIDHGGDDIITIHAAGQVNNVMGDGNNSKNGSSTGGDDRIIIEGTVVFNVRGDSVVNGRGGDDDIVVLSNGEVGGSIYGDWIEYDTGVNRHDKIDILGTVGGNVEGDGNRGDGGRDTITVETGGVVQGSIQGDGVTKSNGNADGKADIINVKGSVLGDVIGDKVDGEGARDVIVIQGSEKFSDTVGNVGGNVIGDQSDWHSAGDDIYITRYAQVDGNVFGDNINRSPGNGGNDNIQIDGRVGTPGSVHRVIGDKANGKGGNDFLHVETHGAVYGDIIGDDVEGVAGQDLIWIDGLVARNVIGDRASGGNSKDQIAVRQGGLVNGSVFGDGSNNPSNGGWDVINVLDGQIDGDLVGDDVGGNGGNDFMAIRMNGLVKGDFVGDDAGNLGGNDTLSLINGTVNGDMIGDYANGSGGDDKLNVLVSGTVKGDLIGDESNGTGGDDNIFVAGKVNGVIYGDHKSRSSLAGSDTIQTSPSSIIGNGVIGDSAKGRGGDDTIKVNGVISDGGIYGDVVTGLGGNDNISVFSLADVTGYIVGDDADASGGNDTIYVAGKVDGGVYGDGVGGNGGDDNITIADPAVISLDIVGDDADGAGGNDTIVVEYGSVVQRGVFGDYSKGKGGDDDITIGGIVLGPVIGDSHKEGSTANGGNDTINILTGGGVGGDIVGDALSVNGGNDKITVWAGALVLGSVFGDGVSNNGGNDTIDIYGEVQGNVLGDSAGGAGGQDVIRIHPSGVVGGNVCGKNDCNDNPGDSIVFLDEDANLNLDSADTIVIAGKVLGNVIAGNSYGDSDDTVVVVEGAAIGGTVYAGDETNGDSFIYVENIINEEKTISEVVNSVTEKNGKVTVNGMTYTLDDVESVSGAVGQIACFGMDYRMNKASDGCSARSQSEKDAIEWHLNNPGNDGRLPGLEGCAVYPYGDALRVYEIMEGAEGQLVAEIWGDVLRNAPASNELLGATADGNIALYHLTSGELQIECKNFVDGKTQVRVLSDLAGTVTNAYDKG